MGRAMFGTSGRYIPTSGASVTQTDYSYTSHNGVANLSNQVSSGSLIVADGIPCSGSGATWQVPPLLF